MASSRSNISYHVRSASFPSTSHPTTVLTVEDQLNQIKISTTPSAEEICNNLSALEDLYKSMDAFLSLQKTQQVLSHNQSEKQVDELLDGSVKILDVCSAIRDLVSQIKENVRDLQSALRRRKGDSSVETSITKYTSFQKKMKKDAKRLIASLKQMKSKNATAALTEVDHQVPEVIRIVREVSAVAMTIFQSILLLVPVPVSKPKKSKWSLFSKAEVECEINIEGFESRIEGIEKGLEGVFRGMVRTRASLLNTISSY